MNKKIKLNTRSLILALALVLQTGSLVLAQSTGGTSLYDAIDYVVATAIQGVGGRKAIILLTDGIDTASTKATFESSANVVAESNFAVFPFNFHPKI